MNFLGLSAQFLKPFCKCIQQFEPGTSKTCKLKKTAGEMAKSPLFKTEHGKKPTKTRFGPAKAYLHSGSPAGKSHELICSFGRREIPPGTTAQIILNCRLFSSCPGSVDSGQNGTSQFFSDR
jgi:hypothetical protein